MGLILQVLRRFAKPFVLGHIYGADGSLYMERFALFSFPGFAARLHHIVREDRDRHLHDHPWDFWSIMLPGGSYVEARPYDVDDPLWIGEEEVTVETVRLPGSIAFRRATDRHKITAVTGEVWTLFITGPYKNQWGFFTRKGKVPYRAYLGLPPKDAV